MASFKNRKTTILRHFKTVITIEEIISNSIIDVSDKAFKFERSHFKPWQQKMKFYLTLKKFANILTGHILVTPSRSTVQSYNKKYVDSDGKVTSSELDHVA